MDAAGKLSNWGKSVTSPINLKTRWFIKKVESVSCWARTNMSIRRRVIILHLCKIFSFDFRLQFVSPFHSKWVKQQKSVQSAIILLIIFREKRRPASFLINSSTNTPHWSYFQDAGSGKIIDSTWPKILRFGVNSKLESEEGFWFAGLIEVFK